MAYMPISKSPFPSPACGSGKEQWLWKRSVRHRSHSTVTLKELCPHLTSGKALNSCIFAVRAIDTQTNKTMTPQLLSKMCDSVALFRHLIERTSVFSATRLSTSALNPIIFTYLLFHFLAIHPSLHFCLWAHPRTFTMEKKKKFQHCSFQLVCTLSVFKNLTFHN